MRAKALTRGGALAAFVVGTLTFGAGTLGTALLLLAFFISSTLLSRAGKARKRELVDIGKGGARDAAQVLANGGVGTVCAVVWALADRGSGSSLWFIAFAGAYAAATADTWGTEIGTLAGGAPRSIFTFRPIATGLSGGVTRTGTAAEIAGAVWLAVATAISTRTAGIIVPVALGGISGALVDSLLGATLQELRRCPACERTCETNPHLCGTPTTLVRGVRGFSNDLVNLIATLTGATTAWLLAHVMA